MSQETPKTPERSQIFYACFMDDVAKSDIPIVLIGLATTIWELQPNRTSPSLIVLNLRVTQVRGDQG